MSKLNVMATCKTAALAALLALGAATAQAQPMGRHHGAPGMMAGPGFEHMLELVDASDTQRSQIKQIMKSAMDDLKSQRESMRKLHEQGQALLTAPTVDANAVESLRQQSQAVHEVVSKRMSQALVAAANVLTPEQRAKLAERMAKRKARMAERVKDHGGAARSTQ